MLAKKAMFGMPFLFWPSMLLLLIILIFYSFVFFGLGAAKSPDVVAKASDYSDSGKLIALLSFPVDDSGRTVSDVLSSNPKEDKIKLVEKQVRLLLLQFEKPKDKNAFWNFVVSADSKEIISIRESSIGADRFFEQEIYLPSKDKSLFKVNLFLNCFGCSEEDLSGI
ncbi:MAG TPA: hypothetical protein VJG30_04400 [Candidatus Nanoarchaeia archaeon]|nr:hypothetical protein [Candidatus Nanoarchaeia archaeon]